MTSPSGSKLRTTLVVAVSIVAGLLVGPIAGAAAAALTAPEPRGPSGPPAVTGPFPTEANVYLPEVTVSLIAKNFLERAKWRCLRVPLTALIEPAKLQTECRFSRSPADLNVYIGYDDESKVRSVHALCWRPPGTKVCDTLFSSIAELSLTGQPDLRKRAATWAADNADRDGTAVIGGVRFVIQLDPRAIRVFPAD